MSRFDVWIIRFEPGDASPAERLERAFGLDAASARSLEQGIPKVVKHAVPAKAAGEMRIALEAIGAVVECRPAREAKPVTGATGRDRAAVFSPPGADLFPAGRLSAIDPFAAVGEPGSPRISVDEALPRTGEAEIEGAPKLELPEESSDSTASVAPPQRQRRRVTRAAAALGAVLAILAVGYFLGNSLLRGTPGLEAARDGDRGTAELWIDRTLRGQGCELYEAREYLGSSATRQYVSRPDYVETFVEKIYAGGAPNIEVCSSDKLGFEFAHYLLVSLPDDVGKQEAVIADAQSLVRRDAVVYRGVTSAEVEQIVRSSTLIGTRRALVELPTGAN
ncbi:MAG: hypothetical protein KJN97_11385 [Deltaproteobacteria bacterium]|nr:hypothetical protein [Deltaproteobacteria bacterium]